MKKFTNLGLFKSKGRIFKESNNQYRTPFQRDKDRIVHSASFRRLKHKTQVFVNTEGDHYRTRITHSIEVAQIARSITKYLNLNDDLAETLSLAHDLGHTPFGHAGEVALNDCMSNHGGFDHNLQTLRIVMFLENKYLKFRGLNLTVETLDGLLKHNGPIFNLSKINEIVGLKNLKNKIYFKKNRQEKNNYIISIPNKNNNLIRVLKGPQHDYFSDSSKKNFCSKNYKISNLTDRMGMRLEGTFLKNVISTNIRSEGIIKGSIQVPADGQPIILLNDHPTIGGYPKIANVISADYDLLIQNVPGTNLSFKYIELEEAEKAFELYSENIKKALETKSIIK